MRIYEDYRTPDEWAITYTLKLEDDGKFLYDEYWACYAGNAGGGANGRWWQSDNTIFFHTEHADENIRLDLIPGQDRIAFEEGDTLKFSEWITYRLCEDSTRNLPPSADSTYQTTPNKLSPELAACISQWIEELSAGGVHDRIANLGKRFNFLPLHTTIIYMWALNLDGVVMCLDHESISDRPEPETSPLTIYAVLVHGARSHRELAELIPPCPEGVRQCSECGGMGWKKSPDKGTDNCFRCQSLGWYIPATAR